MSGVCRLGFFVATIATDAAKSVFICGHTVTPPIYPLCDILHITTEANSVPSE